MVKRGTDLDAPVLERHHVADIGARPRRSCGCGAIGKRRSLTLIAILALLLVEDQGPPVLLAHAPHVKRSEALLLAGPRLGR